MKLIGFFTAWKWPWSRRAMGHRKGGVCSSGGVLQKIDGGGGGGGNQRQGENGARRGAAAWHGGLSGRIER